MEPDKRKAGVWLCRAHKGFGERSFPSRTKYVLDNGLGMTEEQVENLLTDHAHVSSKRGSGIGVKNVNERIRLYFGNEYGLFIESEPDEGTTIRIHLPAVDYREIQEKEKTV